LRPGWPQTWDPPASTAWVLGLQACTTMPGSEIFYNKSRPYFILKGDTY
jgi:hypothetical protein